MSSLGGFKVTTPDLHVSVGGLNWATLGTVVEIIAVLAAGYAWHWLMTLNLRRK
jgi:hypothetical protein